MIESYGKSRISTVAEVDDMSSHSNLQSTVNTFKRRVTLDKLYFNSLKAAQHSHRASPCLLREFDPQ